jgi:hypothetical protein
VVLPLTSLVPIVSISLYTSDLEFFLTQAATATDYHLAGAGVVGLEAVLVVGLLGVAGVAGVVVPVEGLVVVSAGLVTANFPHDPAAVGVAV